jgi:hypothetical protein
MEVFVCGLEGLVEDRKISFKAVTFVNFSARAGLPGASNTSSVKF